MTSTSRSQEQDILNRMCKQARECRNAWELAANSGLAAVAEIQRRRWESVADACHAFAAREGLKVRKGQVGG